MRWLVLLLVCLHTHAVRAESIKDIDILAWFERGASRAGIARKTSPVDARPAKAGEVVVTIIRGEGKETQSPPAKAGDVVVRNRCAGNRQRGNPRRPPRASRSATTARPARR